MLLQDSPDIKAVLSDAEGSWILYIYLLCCMIGTFVSRGDFIWEVLPSVSVIARLDSEMKNAVRPTFPEDFVL